ncbi:hypothetical protein F4677DRAFT_79151 [Hypoxylon crocopeplum]|nr:hypothetical protein F4677DRAFT_79151 [Hypoxylon crocopeplum]
MFRKLSKFRKKDRDEGRIERFHRTSSESRSSNSSPSSASGQVQGDQVGFVTGPCLSKPIATTSNVQSQRNVENEPGPLGLTVVYMPQNAHKADIIFIHGLGGTSRQTWSKHRDPELFWPSTFLPLEPGICLARILTFGYNANFRKAGSVSTSILDFAKELLFELKYAKDEEKADLNMGSVPLIFVVHSMGGLIVKEAYIQGQIDPEYESIVKAISAIIFLATPHRGTLLAESLNRILQSTMVINPKQYISDLAKNSLALQRLNEQFRHIAPQLDIISFYETQPTPIMLARIMILEKDSSILGYPGEVSKALDADHHGICKYESPKDPNYIAVRNVLMSLLGKISSPDNLKNPALSSQRELRELKSLLAITELPATDYSYFRDQWANGTCEWILQEQNFVEWFQSPEPTSRLLWLNGGAATGKSVLSSFIINNLIGRGACCQYFFIRFADQKKRTLSLLLRSIAFQVAQVTSSFLQKLLELADEAVDYETAYPRTIWERIFKSILFNMEGRKPLYWIIDGLDEAHDPRAIIKLLSDISCSSVPLRIMLIGRNTSEIRSAFQKVPSSLNLGMISIEGHLDDLQCYVRQELSMAGSSELREGIIKRIVEGSQNNFLWIRLAVDKLNLCHRLADVELALQQLPIGMEAIYDRMASSIAQNPSPTNKFVASNILQCVTCSFHELTITDLAQVLDEEMSDLLDLERSILDLCGGFVVIDNGGHVSMIHQTAREYLLSGDNHPFHVDPSGAHEHMFLRCMKCLMTIGLRGKVNRNQVPEFAIYASNWWSSHLISTPPDSAPVGKVLKKFLTGHWVLTWVQVLAANNQQRILVQTSKILSDYCLERQRGNAAQKDKTYHIVRQELLESWSIDFVKLVGKFGANLRRNPEAIYKLIPPFCPRNSSIYQLFGKAEARSIAISGISTEDWDDSLSRISLRSGTYASSIKASGALVAILAPSGSVFIHDSSSFEEEMVSPIEHGERVYRMELNSAATLLATYGYRTTKIWEISTGNCIVSVDNLQSRPRPLSMLFTSNNTTLIVGAEDRRIRSLDLKQQFPTWELVAELEEPELEGHFLNSSSYMALNEDGTLIAVAYRGHPLSAWELDGPVHLGHCWRKTREGVARGEVVDAVWRPHSLELLGLYVEGVLFKWCPYNGEIVEMAIGASKLTISGDGNLLATGDGRGTVKVYITSDLALIYQLTSQDAVLDLTFSPDNRRLYDIRGFYGNAWEPNVLMKIAEQTVASVESGSETEGFPHSLTTYSNSSRRIDSITVLSASPIGRLYSYGTEAGAVRLIDSHKGKGIDIHKSMSRLSIEQMTWNDDGRHICFADSGKRIFVVSVSLDTSDSGPVVETTAEISVKNITKGPIIQLLFQPSSSYLLVSTPNGIHTISLAAFSVAQSVELDSVERKWIEHPQDPELIIGFGPKRIQILDWNLVEKKVYTASWEDSSALVAVDSVLVTKNKKHLLVQTSCRKHNSKEKTLYYFETAKFPISSEAAPNSNQREDIAFISPITLPQEVSSEIAISLTFLSHDRLILLSREFSIWSWQLASGLSGAPMAVPTPRLSSSSAVVQSPSLTSPHRSNATISSPLNELFSLPGDWISRDCLSLCIVWGVEKSFLCPRNGEVAVVRCAALV